MKNHGSQLSTSFSHLHVRGPYEVNAQARDVLARASLLEGCNNGNNKKGNVRQARMPTKRRRASGTATAFQHFCWLPLLLGMMGSARVTLAQSTAGAPTILGALASPTVLPTGSPTFEPIVYNFDDFPYCNLTTQEMKAVNVTDGVEPCILFDIKPKLMHFIPYRTKIITIVQVTPATSCRDARDGAVTGVELLNAQNNGSGIAIGFNKDFHVQFRFVSLIAGNADQMGKDIYGRHHAAVLTSAIKALEAYYIVGGCSFIASFEKEPALATQTMVLAQVGPPGFYADDNPYVFGVHINSDEYPIPAVRALGFAAAAVPAENPTSSTRQPVIVVYRTQSEFFRSTCESAVRTARQVGFVNITEVVYDPGADHDEDEVVNEKDEEFLLWLADETCPPGSGQQDDAVNPAIFACFLAEQDIVLKRWKENGCRPVSLWLTAATWAWADENPTVVPYMQGGGQWHEAFRYSARFFASGTDVLLYNEEKSGYYGSYDTVVAYAIPLIFAQHLEAFYRVVDDPDPDSDFGTEEGYELLRRAMVVLNIDTIFGPLSYNEDQRNVGRGAAATQWQWHKVDSESVFGNLLVSPASQAEAVIVLPAPSAVNCSPGNYVNETMVVTGDAILESKCDQCPADTFTAESNQQQQCQACPEASSTDGHTGESKCIRENENLLSPGTLAFGYTVAGITWILSIAFAGWLFKYRNDPVVLLSQLEFMLMVCLGAVISSSTIFALSVQAGSGEDTTSASRACQAATFLYTTGWVLQYASLSAKSWRLHRIMNGGAMRRVKVTAWETGAVVAAILALDWIVVITWTVVDPLEYVREVISVEVDDVNHVTTINSRGSCSIVDGPSIWAFVGPIVGIHFLLMVGTNTILYSIRNMDDRYQEGKYVGLASLFVCEVLVIGLPVVISVNENPVAVFIVLSGIIALNDIGMLCFVFLPKIKYQRKGFEEGVKFGETILKKDHKKASQRESVMRSHSFLASSAPMPSTASWGRLSHSTGDGLGPYMGASSFEAMPSIVDDEVGESEDESSKDQEKLEQAARTKWNARASSRRSLTAKPAIQTGDDEDGMADLREKYEDVMLKNYGLEMEMKEIHATEAGLRKRVGELETLVDKFASFLESQR